MWKFKNTLLNNQWLKTNQKENKKIIEKKNKMKIQHGKTYGMQQK